MLSRFARSSAIRSCLFLVTVVALLGLVLPGVDWEWFWLAVGMTLCGVTIAARDATTKRRGE